MTPTPAQIKSHPHIRKVDSDDMLDLYSYDAQHVGTTDDAILEACRGVVLHQDAIVYSGQSYVRERITTELSEEWFEQHKADYCYESVEGTTLRLFHFQHWYISTSRKLSAFKSHWGGTASFGDLFVQALEHQFATNDLFRVRIDNGQNDSVLDKFLATLDTTQCYTFVLTHTKQTRKVCRPNNHARLVHMSPCECELHLPRPTPLHFDSLADLVAYVEATSPLETPGVRLGSYSIISTEYDRYAKIRGNTSRLVYRYLELYNEPEQLKCLKEMCPEYAPDFEALEQSIRRIINVLCEQYTIRYAQGKYLFVHPEYHRILKECVGKARPATRPERMIRHVLFQQPTRTIYNLMSIKGV
jgi:hypothetical protein